MSARRDHQLRCLAAELTTLDELHRRLDSAQLFLDEVSRALADRSDPAAAHGDLVLALHQLRTAADQLAHAYVSARGIDYDLPPRPRQ